MGNPAQLPSKEQVTDEIRHLATTLSNDMQAAALAKARELGFDLNKGRLSLEETLLNLGSSRDTLLDAAQKRKLSQLPLKVQYTLWTQVQRISESLTALVNGTDTVLNLEEAVDDLLASIWQYNLHNLSEQVLGFQEKMNQLKSQETIILRAHRQAQAFQETVARVEDLIRILEDARNIADKTKDHATTTEQETRTILTRAQEQEQRVSALAAQAEQENSAASTQAANARAAAAEAQAIAERLPSIQADLASQQAEITEVLESTRKRSTEFEATSSSALKEFKVLVRADEERHRNNRRRNSHEHQRFIVRVTHRRRIARRDHLGAARKSTTRGQETNQRRAIELRR